MKDSARQSVSIFLLPLARELQFVAQRDDRKIFAPWGIEQSRVQASLCLVPLL